MDESFLINEAQQGDLDAFNRLVLAYQNMVYTHAYRMMGDADSAEDATQNAFIAAYKNVNKFRGGSFRAWLLRIVTNICYDELRRRKRKPVTALEPITNNDEEIESPSWISDPSDSPEDEIIRKELSIAIQECLDGLSPEFRSMIVLIDIQGFDYKEAAETISKPVGTVKSRLARARLRMRDCLQKFRELLPDAFRLVKESEL